MRFLNERAFSDFITDKIPKYSTYILTDGKFVDLYDGTHNAFKEYCRETGIEYKNALKDSIQLNDGKSTVDEMPYAYIQLPKSLTTAQYSSLLKWLDKLDYDDEVEVVTNNGSFKKYSLIDYTTDEIIKKIRRYYSSGILYEAKERNN